jgi:protein-tyrosine-phosphatase
MRTRVLFLCTDNAVQSPAAEAILRAVVGDLRFEALSAGVTPVGAFDRRLLASLQAHGVAPPPGAPKGIEAVAGKAYDHVVTLTDDVQETGASVPAAEWMHWSFALDGTDDLAYRRLIVGLRRRIELFVTVIDKARDSSR